MDEIARNIETNSDRLRSHEIADILRAISGFDSETCDEIAKLDFEEAFEMAYGYLAQAGLDADETLADFLD